MRKRISSRRLSSSLIILGLLLGRSAAAGDWPQILGPERNGTAPGERLAASWPESGPETLWQQPVGSGLAGVAVSGNRVILFHRIGDREVVEALDAASGKKLWKAAFPTSYVCSIVEDSGPRCVPLIHQERVMVYGAEGRLVCLQLQDGKVLWQRHIDDDFGLPPSYFGAGSTPIVEGDRLLLNVGSRPGAGIVAFALDDGKTLWKATDEGPSYSSPMAATIDRQRHIVFITRLNAVSVDPADGSVLFRIPFGSRGPTVNGATPLLVGRRHLFLTASYGVGAKLVRVADSKADVVWENDRTMSSQYPTPVEHQGVLYGIHGRQDVGTAALRAIDPLTGEVLWSQDEFGMAVPILAGDKLLLLKTDGTLVLAQPDRKRYRELARATVFDTTCRALPALAGGRLYARDTGTLKCIELGEAGR